MAIDLFSSFPTIIVAAVFFLGSFILGFWLHWFLNSSRLNSRIAKLENLSSVQEDSLVEFEQRINANFIESLAKIEACDSRTMHLKERSNVVFSELEKYCVRIESESRAVRRKHENLALENASYYDVLESKVEENSKNIQTMINKSEERDIAHIERQDEIESKIEKFNFSDFANKKELGELMRKSDLINYASSNDLDEFYLKNERAIYTLKNEITSLSKALGQTDSLTRSDLNDYVTKSSIEKHTSEMSSLKEKLMRFDILKADKSNVISKVEFVELSNEFDKVKLEHSEQKHRIEEIDLRFNDVESSKVHKLFSSEEEKSEDAGMLSRLSIKDIDINAKRKDDLQLVKGIGPFIEEEINALGIFTFVQLAALSQEDIDLITEALQIFPGRIKRDKWMQQAKQLDKKLAA